MEKLFVSYEVAMQLKEKGFDENCVAKYNKKRQIDFFENPRAFWCVNSKSSFFSPIFSSKKTVDKVCTAPTHSQVANWFINKHNILIGVDYDTKSYFWFVNDLAETKGGKVIQGEFGLYSTYNEAFDKAIEQALKMI